MYGFWIPCPAAGRSLLACCKVFACLQATNAPLRTAQPAARQGIQYCESMNGWCSGKVSPKPIPTAVDRGVFLPCEKKARVRTHNICRGDTRPFPNEYHPAGRMCSRRTRKSMAWKPLPVASIPPGTTLLSTCYTPARTVRRAIAQNDRPEGLELLSNSSSHLLCSCARMSLRLPPQTQILASRIVTDTVPPVSCAKSRPQ